jgi:hypothetical protein
MPDANIAPNVTAAGRQRRAKGRAPKGRRIEDKADTW